MTQLTALFPDENYRFHLGLRRGDPADFFAAKDGTGRLLAERRRWLAADPNRYARLLPGNETLLNSTILLADRWGAKLPADGSDLLGLGTRLEPDFLLLAPEAGGEITLRGGVLCFPSSWALEDKLGRTIDFIHSPVPGLNEALGDQIRQFFGRIKPGDAFSRQNWGLAAVDEMNMHPALGRPRPVEPLVPSQLWLRIEHQLLMALPAVEGWLFGIRIELVGLEAVQLDLAAAAGLRRALATMSERMADYKGVSGVRGPLLDWLDGCS